MLRTVASEEEEEVAIVNLNASVFSYNSGASGELRYYFINLSLILDKRKGDTNDDRDILDCNGLNDYRNSFFYVVGLGEPKNCSPIAYASIGSDLNELKILAG